MREGSKGWREGREETQEGDSVQDSTGEGSAGEKLLGILRPTRPTEPGQGAGELVVLLLLLFGERGVTRGGGCV